MPLRNPVIDKINSFLLAQFSLGRTPSSGPTFLSGSPWTDSSLIVAQSVPCTEKTLQPVKTCNLRQCVILTTWGKWKNGDLGLLANRFRAQCVREDDLQRQGRGQKRKRKKERVQQDRGYLSNFNELSRSVQCDFAEATPTSCHVHLDFTAINTDLENAYSLYQLPV